MRKFVLAASAAAAFAATPALAQDGPPVDPVFTGPRVGAIVGYDHVGAGSDVSNNNGRDDQKIDGLLYGGDVGYDLAVGRLLVGAEGEVTASTASSSRNPYTSTTFGYGRVRQLRDLYVGGRVGILASPTTMIYAKGGYTNSQLRVLAGSTNFSTNNRFELDGYRVGAGVEHAVGPHSYAKVEYRYSNYGRADVLYGSGATSGRFDVDTDRHQVVASYGFRF
ncbi:outer membrane protein [Sphingomonas sp.]|uniref:outer membrane protein n=1 Tax=Sphingomonas sp. TaxID=28214 RepID=UPI003B00199F